MALFKVLKGNRSALSAQALHDGYAYFCVDDGSFHIDYTDADGNLQRKQLNAKDAETLTGMTLEEIRKSISWNDLTDKPFYETTEYVEVINLPKIWGSNVYTNQYARDRGINFALEAGKKYKVCIGKENFEDTKEFEVIARTETLTPIGECVVIGGKLNGYTILDTADLTIPFAINTRLDNNRATIIWHTSLVDGDTISCSIHEVVENVKPLDPKFLPSEIARTSDVDTALATKAEVEHTHEISDVNGLQTALDNLELITVEDIDTICGTVIQLASETTF